MILTSIPVDYCFLPVAGFLKQNMDALLLQPLLHVVPGTISHCHPLNVNLRFYILLLQLLLKALLTALFSSSHTIGCQSCCCQSCCCYCCCHAVPHLQSKGGVTTEDWYYPSQEKYFQLVQTCEYQGKNPTKMYDFNKGTTNSPCIYERGLDLPSLEPFGGGVFPVLIIIITH